MDIQTVEFGKIASKVENNITIKMTVDGVEQKIRVDAIGFDEAGNIRIQEYTTAQNGLKISRQNLLEDLSKYGGTIVGAGKGDFVGGVEIPKGTRIDVVSQWTSNYSLDGNGNKFEVITLENGETAYLSKSTDFNGNSVPVRSLDYLKADGTINWPNEDGVVLKADGSADKTEAVLRAGEVIDRFGSPYGAFTSPVKDGVVLEYDTRGLPYPESYQEYHQYEITTDITMENIQKAYDNLPGSSKIEFDTQLARRRKELPNLASNYIGTIDTVFGTGGGTQIQFGGALQFYIDLGLVREILP
ncbi:glycohydrolase toxin TNT-related protein [Streptococcus suis]|uniref:glycohydrolase toxin TNT-related protein n=1 Tax=Streptococcus suis TaxID=1307 RepID=UPI00147888E6